MIHDVLAGAVVGGPLGLAAEASPYPGSTRANVLAELGEVCGTALAPATGAGGAAGGRQGQRLMSEITDDQ